MVLQGIENMTEQGNYQRSKYILSVLDPKTGAYSIPDNKLTLHLVKQILTNYQVQVKRKLDGNDYVCDEIIGVFVPPNSTNIIGYIYGKSRSDTQFHLFDIIRQNPINTENYDFKRTSSNCTIFGSATLNGLNISLSGSAVAAHLYGTIRPIEQLRYGNLTNLAPLACDKVSVPNISKSIVMLSIPMDWDQEYYDTSDGTSLYDLTPEDGGVQPTTDLGSVTRRVGSPNHVYYRRNLEMPAVPRGTKYLIGSANVQAVGNVHIAGDISYIVRGGGEARLINFFVIELIGLSGELVAATAISDPAPQVTGWANDSYWPVPVNIDFQLGDECDIVTAMNIYFNPADADWEAGQELKVDLDVTTTSYGLPNHSNGYHVVAMQGLSEQNVLNFRNYRNHELVPNDRLALDAGAYIGPPDPATIHYLRSLFARRKELGINTVYSEEDYIAMLPYFENLADVKAAPPANLPAHAFSLLGALKSVMHAVAPVLEPVEQVLSAVPGPVGTAAKIASAVTQAASKTEKESPFSGARKKLRAMRLSDKTASSNNDDYQSHIEHTKGMCRPDFCPMVAGKKEFSKYICTDCGRITRGNDPYGPMRICVKCAKPKSVPPLEYFHTPCRKCTKRYNAVKDHVVIQNARFSPFHPQYDLHRTVVRELPPREPAKLPTRIRTSTQTKVEQGLALFKDLKEKEAHHLTGDFRVWCPVHIGHGLRRARGGKQVKHHTCPECGDIVLRLNDGNPRICYNCAGYEMPSAYVHDICHTCYWEPADYSTGKWGDYDELSYDNVPPPWLRDTRKYKRPKQRGGTKPYARSAGSDDEAETIEDAEKVEKLGEATKEIAKDAIAAEQEADQAEAAQNQVGGSETTGIGPIEEPTTGPTELAATNSGELVDRLNKLESMLSTYRQYLDKSDEAVQQLVNENRGLKDEIHDLAEKHQKFKGAYETMSSDMERYNERARAAEARAAEAERRHEEALEALSRLQAPSTEEESQAPPSDQPPSPMAQRQLTTPLSALTSKTLRRGYTLGQLPAPAKMRQEEATRLRNPVESNVTGPVNYEPLPPAEPQAPAHRSSVTINLQKYTPPMDIPTLEQVGEIEPPAEQAAGVPEEEPEPEMEESFPEPPPEAYQTIPESRLERVRREAEEILASRETQLPPRVQRQLNAVERAEEQRQQLLHPPPTLEEPSPVPQQNDLQPQTRTVPRSDNPFKMSKRKGRRNEERPMNALEERKARASVPVAPRRVTTRRQRSERSEPPPQINAPTRSNPFKGSKQRMARSGDDDEQETQFKSQPDGMFIPVTTPYALFPVIIGKEGTMYAAIRKNGPPGRLLGRSPADPLPDMGLKHSYMLAPVAEITPEGLYIGDLENLVDGTSCMLALRAVDDLGNFPNKNNLAFTGKVLGDDICRNIAAPLKHRTANLYNVRLISGNCNLPYYHHSVKELLNSLRSARADDTTLVDALAAWGEEDPQNAKVIDIMDFIIEHGLIDALYPFTKMGPAVLRQTLEGSEEKQEKQLRHRTSQAAANSAGLGRKAARAREAGLEFVTKEWIQDNGGVGPSQLQIRFYNLTGEVPDPVPGKKMMKISAADARALEKADDDDYNDLVDTIMENNNYPEEARNLVFDMVEANGGKGLRPNQVKAVQEKYDITPKTKGQKKAVVKLNRWKKAPKKAQKEEEEEEEEEIP